MPAEEEEEEVDKVEINVEEEVEGPMVKQRQERI